MMMLLRSFLLAAFFLGAHPHDAALAAQPSMPPTRLIIPRLRLSDAPIVPMPIVNGAWDEYAIGTREVGLLQTTGRWPRDALAMVLAGHVTLEGDQAGPFYGLGRLRAGDLVVLQTRDGRLWRYRVTRQYLLGANDVKALYRPDGRLLMLLTCTAWDEEAQAYTRRLVVEAMLESSGLPSGSPSRRSACGHRCSIGPKPAIASRRRIAAAQ